MNKPLVNIVIAAAGQGRRMGNTPVNKPFLTLSGQPLLTRCLTFFENAPTVSRIVIVAAAAEINDCQTLVQEHNFTKVAGVIAGGAERQDSVFKGLEFLATSDHLKCPLVAVHDAARPFLSAALFQELLTTALAHGAAVPGLPVKDTIKLIKSDDTVETTLPRAQLVAVQTPQVFAFTDLLQAYQKAQAKHYQGTDDASLFEMFVGAVKIVKTAHDNLKITTPTDLLLAEALAQNLE